MRVAVESNCIFMSYCLSIFFIICTACFAERNDSQTEVCSNAVRVRRLRDYCQSHYIMQPVGHQDKRELYWPLLTDDKHRVIYCVIPKAGCTSFKTMMANQTQSLRPETRLRVHSAKMLDSIGLHYLSAYPPEMIKHRLQTYTKVILVRHPFDRLLSAYKDKFVYKRFFSKIYQRFIIKTLGQDAVMQNGRVRISFKQFLELVSHGYDEGFRNHHWESYMNLCLPCHVHYDYILKMETLESDSQEALSVFLNKDQTSVTLPHLNGRRPFVEKLDSVSKAFGEVDPVMIKDLMRIYKADFDVFGYKCNSAKCRVKAEDSYCC